MKKCLIRAELLGSEQGCVSNRRTLAQMLPIQWSFSWLALVGIFMQIAYCDPPNDKANSSQILSRISHGKPVSAVGFIGGGESIMTGCMDGSVRISDVHSGKEKKKRIFFEPEQIVQLVCSSDEKAVFILSGKCVERWDASLDKRAWKFESGTESLFTWLAFDQGSESVAVGKSSDHEILVLDARTGRINSILKRPEGLLQSISFSPGGKRLVAAYSDLQIVIWEVLTGKPIMGMRVPGKESFGATFSPDARTVANCCGDGIVRLWDAEKGVELHQFRRGIGTPTLARFHGKDRLYTSDTQGVIIQWDVAQRKMVRKFGLEKTEVVDFAISPDGKRIAAAYESGNVLIIDLGRQ